MKKYFTHYVMVAAFLITGCVIWTYSSPSTPAELSSSEAAEERAPEYLFGFDKSTHIFEDYRIKRNAFMGDILMSQGIDFDRIIELEKKAEDVFSLRKIAAGKDITFIKDDLCAPPLGFVYRRNRIDYVTYKFRDEIDVTKSQLPTEVCIETASGTIVDNLSNSLLTENGLGVMMADKMEDALGQINFFSCQPGDKYKVVFEQRYVDGEPAGVGRLLSASYKTKNNEYFGFYYENDKYQGYYDENGSPNKRTFLNAPVKASRISSVFNMNRYHPILKRRKPHLGTDYAAPRGTEIYAVADGIVSKRSYTKGNGNYIKIKHDKVYQTQYLHMSKFAKNIRPGTRVKQGQVIGYVGSTGLATGPHVCFRFWKNGRQIDHRRENFPPLNPMDDSELPEFYQVRNAHLQDLAGIDYPDEKVAFASVRVDTE